jgi:DNA-binding LacI/PurR family transcriptional regulator
VGLLLVPERGGVRDAVVDALCLYSLPAEHPSVAAARECGLPLVVVDEPRIDGHAFVASDDRRGARLAVEHLLALEHRRFALLATSVIHRNRLAGYLEALEAAGVEWAGYELAANSHERGLEGARRALAAEPRPTALIAAADQLALGALQAASEAGLRVPDEVSVVGFDDIPGAAWSRPALTTVRQPMLEKGEVAGRLLSDGPDGREVILPVELVVRGSTARA